MLTSSDAAPRQRKRTPIGAISSPRSAMFTQRKPKACAALLLARSALFFPLLSVILYLLLTNSILICQHNQTGPQQTFAATSSRHLGSTTKPLFPLWKLERSRSPTLSRDPIVFRQRRSATKTTVQPNSSPLIRFLDPDFGGLHISSFMGNHLDRRAISSSDEYHLRMERLEMFDAAEQAIKDNDDDVSHWFDPYDDLEYDKERHHAKWSYEVHPVCNIFHEGVHLTRMPEEYNIRFLDEGGFRLTWLMTPTTDHAPVVLKMLRMKRDFDRYNMRNIAKEPLLMSVMNRKWTSETYGHCATSVMVEKGKELWDSIIPNDKSKTGRMKQKDLDKQQKEGVKSQNKLSNEEKLEIALAMGEGLAQMHSMGVFHADVTLYQWLRSANDNRVVLNDFNHAEFLLFSEHENKFRKFYSHYDWGVSKAPEEYRGGYAGRSADVWSFGNLLFTLLTGT